MSNNNKQKHNDSHSFETNRAYVMKMANFIAFYNCGPESGASQPHKHMQLLPAPLSGTRIEDGDFPLQPLFESTANQQPLESVFQVNGLNFLHGALRLKKALEDKSIEDLSKYLLMVYNHVIDVLGMKTNPGDKIANKSYNFLMTKSFMWIVPRKSDTYNGIEINSVGLFGSILAKSSDRLEQIKTIGPYTILQNVTFPL
jgi:ATP adenylyltransferase